MDINYSQLMAQLAAQKQGSEALWDQNDPGQKRSRAMKAWINAMGDRAALQPRQATFAQPRESVEDRVAHAKNAAGGGASDGSDPDELKRNLYNEIKYRKAMGLPLEELSATGMTDDQYRNQYQIDKLKQSEGVPLTKSTAAPLQNYLAGVEDQSSYRAAMMQNLAAGGKVPKWYTGDYENDKQNIDIAVKSSMTPKDQMIRADAQQKMADLEDARQARLQLQRDALEERKKQHALAQENIANKGTKQGNIIPNKDQRNQAADALEARLGSDVFKQLPYEQAQAVAREAASKAKAMMATPEGKGIDYATLVNDQIEEMIAKGNLNPGKEGTGVLGFFGLGGEKPSYKPVQNSQAPKVQTGVVTVNIGGKPVQAIAPKTMEDFNALPVGAVYVHPENGKLYRKQ